MPAHSLTLRDRHGGDRSTQDSEALITRETGVAEVIIPPRSDLLAASVFLGMVTNSGDLVVLAVQRNGEDREGETTLAVGDTLLLQGDCDALDENLEDPDVLVVAASASLLTPIATPANMMVMGPGGYRFGGYWRLGLCVLVVFGLVSTLLAPVFWSF